MLATTHGTLLDSTVMDNTSTMNPLWNTIASQAIEGQPVNREDARSVLNAESDELLPLLQAGFRVRHHFHGRTIHVHVLENAKLGACPEDCSFCSQSASYNTEVGQEPFASIESLVENAHKAQQSGAYRYCMVTATRSPSQRDLDVICAAAEQIKKETSLSLCASLGLLTEQKAQRLKNAGVDRFNHNLETSERHFPSIVSTHTWADRMQTLMHAQQAGLETCSGGIIGLDETQDDILDLAYTLSDIKADSVPINFLDPREGTPLGKNKRIEPTYALRVLTMFRFLNPRADLRLAGGREVTLRTLQPLALYVVNSIFTEGYLTTPGAKASEDHRMIIDAGFDIEMASGKTHLPTDSSTASTPNKLPIVPIHNPLPLSVEQ